jgi:hypothetical protein
MVAQSHLEIHHCSRQVFMEAQILPGKKKKKKTVKQLLLQPAD